MDASHVLPLLLALVVASGGLLLLATTATPGAGLGLAAALAVPQVFVGSTTISSLPLAQLWSLLMVVAVVLLATPRVRLDLPLALLLAICALTVLALLWSPDRRLGAVAVLRLASFVVLAVHATSLAARSPRSLDRALAVLVPALLVQALLVLAFWLSPAAEMRFLTSWLGEVVIGPENLRRLFTTSRDNVFDPAKSGGVYVNANTASMFLGAGACAVLGAAARRRSRGLALAGLAVLCAVPCTGSKTGVVLGLCLPLLALALPRALSATGRWLLPAVGLGLGVLALLLLRVLPRLVPSFAEQSGSTMGTRQQLWQAAWAMFQEAPLLGQGFGGWQLDLAGIAGRQGVPASLPPHNVVVYAWSQTGLLCAVLVVLLTLVVLREHLVLVARAADRRQALDLSFGATAFLWVFLHGMADATTFYGDPRTGVVLALLLGRLAVARRAAAPQPATPTTPRPPARRLAAAAGRP